MHQSNKLAVTVATLTAILFTLALAGGVRPPVNCAARPPGFNSLDDPDFTRNMPWGIAPPTIVVIKIERSGIVTWDGKKMSDGSRSFQPTLSKRLSAVYGMNPMPYVSIDFDAGSPCATINEVRAMMVQQMFCEDHRCLQGPH